MGALYPQGGGHSVWGPRRRKDKSDAEEQRAQRGAEKKSPGIDQEGEEGGLSLDFRPGR